MRARIGLTTTTASAETATPTRLPVGIGILDRLSKKRKVDGVDQASPLHQGEKRKSSSQSALAERPARSQDHRDRSLASVPSKDNFNISDDEDATSTRSPTKDEESRISRLQHENAAILHDLEAARGDRDALRVQKDVYKPQLQQRDDLVSNL
jgi:hypothetical protein